MNLLVPSVGRKRYLVERLRRAVQHRGGRLFGTDLVDSAPALPLLDVRLHLPPYASDAYWPAVDRLLHEQGIDAVIPVRDAELFGWAERSAAGRLAATVLVSPADTLRVCRDKVLLYRVATDAGIRCPAWEMRSAATPLPGNVERPFVVKPRTGSGSRGVSVVTSGDGGPPDVDGPADGWLHQAYVAGQEYSIDGYVARDGELVACCARKRLEVRDGECVVGEVVDDAELCAVARKLTAALRFHGVINIQVIVGIDGPELIDLNPRFPGGIAISEAAGFPFIEWAVAELCGERPAPAGDSCSNG